MRMLPSSFSAPNSLKQVGVKIDGCVGCVGVVGVSPIRYAGYVLEASQSLRHMTSVVESADPAFAAANADRARAHAASLALAEADESLTATNGSIGSTGGNFVRKASEAAITVSTDARMHATPEDVERLASDLQANMDVILSTLFPSNNVGEVGSLVAPRSVVCTWMVHGVFTGRIPVRGMLATRDPLPCFLHDPLVPCRSALARNSSV